MIHGLLKYCKSVGVEPWIKEATYDGVSIYFFGGTVEEGIVFFLI
jgi:hypothetical protein